MAQDLDLAAAALGSHVKGEFEKRRKGGEKKLNPPSAGAKGKAKAKHSPYRPLGEDRLQEIWIETVADIIEDKLVFHMDAPEKPKNGDKPARWRIEKPKTGDKTLDDSAHKGVRTSFDEHGRRRAAWDASGHRVFFWKPQGA